MELLPPRLLYVFPRRGFKSPQHTNSETWPKVKGIFVKWIELANYGVQ